MQLRGLLQQEALIDERVEHLAREAHLLLQLRRELVAVHLPIPLLGEVERAVVLGERDGVAVHARGERPVLGTCAGCAPPRPMST